MRASGNESVRQTGSPPGKEDEGVIDVRERRTCIHGKEESDEKEAVSDGGMGKGGREGCREVGREGGEN